EELNKAKALARQALVRELESSAALGGLLGALVAVGLPADEYRKVDADLQRLTSADLKRVADRYLDPDHVTIVVVGDLAKVRPAIEKLGLGPIEVRDAEGRRL